MQRSVAITLLFYQLGAACHRDPYWAPCFFRYIQTMYLLFLNSVLNSYADDIKMFGISGNLLQSDIDVLYKWLESNCLPVNFQKTVVVSAGRISSMRTHYVNGSPIKRVSLFKDLGLLIDFNFNFASHVTNVKLKCYRLINIIFKVFSTRAIFIYLILQFVHPSYY